MRQLFNAIDTEQTDLALSLLENPDIRRNVNYEVNENGFTCLHGACIRGNCKVTQAVLEAGAQPDVCDTNNSTPIHWTARYGYSDCMSMLIKYSCDLNPQSCYGFTPLHLSSREGHTSCVELLLQANCKVDVYNEFGMTSLHIATVNNHLDIVKLLVQYRADVNMKVCQRRHSHSDQLNKTPLQLSIHQGYSELIKYLKTACITQNYGKGTF